MSGENLERVSRYCEAWDGGNTDDVIQALAPDVELSAMPAMVHA